MKKDVIFLGVSTFFKALNIQTTQFEIKQNEENGKWSIVTDSGEFFKCQKGFDSTKPMKFIVEKGKPLSEATLINVREGKLKTMATIKV